MSKQAGGDRVSIISEPGCSTSVALATGPTEEEEEEEEEEGDEEEEEAILSVCAEKFYNII